MLREAARGLPVVIVHPTSVLGPGDRRPTPTGSMLVHFLNGRMKAYTNLVQNLVDVRDVAVGHALALERARPGERYVLGGENLSMREIVETLAEITGLPAPWFAIPHRVLHGISRINEWISDHVTHREPVAPLEAKLHAVDSRPFDASKARRELGFTARPAREVPIEAVPGSCRRGFCPAATAQRSRGAAGVRRGERPTLPARRRRDGRDRGRRPGRRSPGPVARAPWRRGGTGRAAHTDFAREFRGEGLLPGGVDALQQIGLGAELDALPQSGIDRIQLYQELRPLLTVDIPETTGVSAGPRFVSQPALLEMLVAEAGRFPSFRFERGFTVRDLLREGRGLPACAANPTPARARSRRTMCSGRTGAPRWCDGARASTASTRRSPSTWSGSRCRCGSSSALGKRAPISGAATSA